jgi:hypothetical protein
VAHAQLRYRRLVPSLASLFASADDLLVDAVAQPPWCVEPARQDVAEAFRVADAQGFDVLPVLESDGEIRRTVAKNRLLGATSWDPALADASPLTAERLVARESPVVRLLDRLDKDKPLFALGPRGVDGTVTIYDLNQPAAHLFAFGMALICEADLGEFLRDELPDDPDAAFEAAREALHGVTTGLRRWSRMRGKDQHVHVSSTLSFGEKIGVVENLGLDALAYAHDTSSQHLLAELRQICSLRNYDEEHTRLEDSEWVFQALRTAERYARRVISRRPD